MIVRIVKMKFSPEAVPEFLELFNRIKGSILKFSGCRELHLLQNTQYPEEISTYSVWDTKDDLENYRNSPFFQEVWPQTKKLFAGKPEATTFHNIT